MTFTPTITKSGIPSRCRCCGFTPVGIGISNPAKGDPGFLCTSCLLLMEKIQSTRRMSVYELKARQGGVDAAAPLIEEFGADLSQWTEEQALALSGAMWRGNADELHRLLEHGEPPF